jgi:PAS domain S-box-containing protein
MDHITETHLISNQDRLKKLTGDLESSEQRYELAMTGTNAGIWDWDLVNNRIFHGLRWKEMLGYSEDDNMDISIDDFYPLVHPDDLERVKTSLNDHFENKIPYNIEYRIKNKNGSYGWYYDAGKAIWDKTGKPIRMVGSIINVTKRKQDEQQIKQQNELLEKTNVELDRFVYITSHDLKAPLLSILGLINLAELSKSKAEIDNCLTMMKDRVKSLENFISDIIDYSRNVRLGLVKEVVELRRLVEGIISDVMFMENVNKIHFEILIDQEFRFISDERRISVIMKNLISNAIKYHRYDQDNPFISIKAERTPDLIVISVRDNGEGIQAEMIPRIFDMFFRGTEKSNGSGLGLYIVREMMEKLNGHIAVESTLKAGSEFRISLPVIS